MYCNSKQNQVLSFNTLVTYHTLTKTSPSNHTNIYKAQVKKVMGDKLLMFDKLYGLISMLA